MADAPFILSISAFAARRGVGVSTVCKWIERGRISGAALTDDKPRRIVVEEAERQLGVSLDRVRSESAVAAHVERQQPDAPGVRDQILAVDLEHKRWRLEVDKGVYVRADQVRAERGRALTQMIAAIDNWIPDLAADLGLDREGLAKARISWRRFRERQADALLVDADAMPEHLSDAA